MKGIEMPMSLIIVLAIVIILLITISSFFLSGMSGSLNQADIIRVFSESCRKYCNNCDAVVSEKLECVQENFDKPDLNTNCQGMTENAKNFVNSCRNLGYVSSGQTVTKCFTLCKCDSGCTA